MGNSHAEESTGPHHDTFHNVALLAGPALAIACWYFAGGTLDSGPDSGLSPAGRVVLATTVLMAVWWMTEAVHLTITALLPLFLFPLLGVAPVRDIAQPYADPVIYLFFASFIIALSMQRWGLGLRAALLILKRFGTGKRKVVAGVMAVTALFSMFVSNTATVAMMLPIALGIVALGERNSSGGEPGAESIRSSKRFATCIALGTAYASSIGGMATIIGTPPNAFVRSFLAGDALPPEHRLDLTFATWIVWGIPYAAVFLFVTWWLMTRFLFSIGDDDLQGGQELVESELRRLGRIDSGEWWTLAIFSITVILWLIRPLLANWEVGSAGTSWKPLAGLDDGVVAIGAAILLFLIPCKGPSGNRTRVMDWEHARKLPWEVLLLFGGGLSLAASIQKTGVAEWVGQKLVFLSGFPEWLIVLMIVTLVVFLTELTSNLATTASLLPVLAGIALQLGMSPWMLAIPATLAANCAFMLPVATPPNALVFGTGRIRLGEMMTTGVWLNLFAIIWTTLISCTLVKWWLDV